MESKPSFENLDELVELIVGKVTDRLRREGVQPKAPKGEDKSGPGQDAVPAVVSEPRVEDGTRRPERKVVVNGVKIDARIASVIDHTLLKPDVTAEDLLKVCDEARQYGFATVCVNSANIPLVARQLKGSSVLPIAVVGFPLGAATTQAKAFEAREAIRAGAREIDMVINIGALKSKDYRMVYEDIRTVTESSRPHKVKVIIETAQLNDEEKVIACALAKAAGAAFVKTSTGFAGGGATTEDVALMRRVVGEDTGVKASGGIRTREEALKMIQAGANRIGASSSVAIVTGKGAKKGEY